MRQQLLLSPQPFPPITLLFPQQQNRRINGKIQENPFVPSHPHPQLVAVKSLIL